MADRPNSNKGSGVLIGFEGIHVVKGGGFGGVSVAGSEVDAHCEVDLTATHDVLQEGVGLCDLCVCGGICLFSAVLYGAFLVQNSNAHIQLS